VQAYRDYRTDKKDLSQIYIIKKPSDVYTYYAGFAWKKANIIVSPQMWDDYLDKFATRIASPVEIVFEK
jgi:hypothetical protein